MNDTTFQQDARALVADLNLNALLALRSEFGLRFGNGFKDWRPTVRSRGTIAGAVGELTLLATDGIAAYFLRDDGTVLYGHVGHFDGKVAPLFSAATGATGKKVKKPRALSARTARRKLLEDL